MVPTVDYMSSRLTLAGPPEEVAAAREALRSAQPVFLTFAGVAPPANRGDPHDARLAAWGCGLPEIAQVVEDAPDRLSVTCDTGGGVPHLAMRALSERLPGLDVRLEAVWPGEPRGHSFAGSWKGGQGGIAEVEASREHYLRVCPGTEEWELDEMFPGAPRP